MTTTVRQRQRHRRRRAQFEALPKNKTRCASYPLCTQWCFQYHPFVSVETEGKCEELHHEMEFEKKTSVYHPKHHSFRNHTSPFEAMENDCATTKTMKKGWILVGCWSINTFRHIFMKRYVGQVGATEHQMEAQIRDIYMVKGIERM